MANDTNIKSKFFGPNANNTQFTATSSTNLAAEQDPADGADLTLTTIAGNDALCGPGFAQQVKLVSGDGDDNSDVTYTIIGTDAFGASQTEDLTGPAGGEVTFDISTAGETQLVFTAAAAATNLLTTGSMIAFIC